MSAAADRYRATSFWLDDLAARGLDDLEPRQALPGDRHVDICVIGAGFTGLWSALSLRAAEPDASIVVLEQEIAGFGASGRNGGWCSALWPVALSSVAEAHGTDTARALHTALVDTVDEVGRAAAALGIDCDFRKQGTRLLIRNEVAAGRAEAEVADAERLGITPPARRDDGPLGPSLWEPDCAGIHPGKLVRGLARAAEDRNIQIYEGTRVLDWGPHEVTTDRGIVRCDRLVVATEAWGAGIPRSKRRVLPLYSLVIATEPLAESVWDEIGLARGETVSDYRHLLVYGQRTADDRFVFGGRGARYHAGSSIRPEWDRSDKVFGHLQATLGELFPAAASAAITHRWGGPIGVARDWHPTVLTDPARRVAWVAGYVGDGVAATNLAGRTVADLLTGADTPITRLPWVDHHSPRWEPEPVRAIGVNAVIASLGLADTEEALSKRPSLVARAVSLVTG